MSDYKADIAIIQTVDYVKTKECWNKYGSEDQ